MERSSKRGKIPQQDWPAIIKRYEAGETLAGIARTYDCSPPAISYIVSRSRARDAMGEGAIEPVEPRLAKSNATERPPVNASQKEGVVGGVSAGRADAGALHRVVPLTEQARLIEPELALTEPARALDSQKDTSTDPVVSAAEEQDRRFHDANPANADGSAVLNSLSVPQDGGHRRTLHLSSLSEDPPHSDGPNQDLSHSVSSGSGERFAGAAQTAQRPELAEPGRQAPASSRFAPVGINGPVLKDGSAFIDQALRERVDGDITAFLAAFDAALAQDSLENRAGLREATDRLLRAGARTRIELERLEARVPLPPRDTVANARSAWRPR